MVSTGRLKPGKRAVVAKSTLKVAVLNINAKNNNNFAMAA